MEGTKHILIVDDNAMLLRTMKHLLDEAYSVGVAVSGAQALKAMEKKQPDLVLLDQEMPQMSGKEVFLKIKENDAWKDIPVMFLTSATDAETVEELMSLNPAGYIGKPPEKNRLFEAIRSVLD